MSSPFFWADPPEPAGHHEVPWLEPYPDVLLDGIADTDPGPAARYEAREAVSLVFITALQLLPPRPADADGTAAAKTGFPRPA